MSWTLDPRIEATSVFVVDLPICQVRLQNDQRWPWLVLVPRGSGLVEIDQVGALERAVLMEEVVAAGTAVRRLGDAAGRPVEKLNVGALGNVVAQLHVHVVGRRRDDQAWPGPVWGFGEASLLTPERLKAAMVLAASVLGASTPPGTR